MKIYIISLLLSFSMLRVLAQWNSNPSENTVIHNGAGTDTRLISFSDNSGGVISFFAKNDKFLVAQRISSNGTLLWGNSDMGNVVRDTANFTLNIYGIPDGAGGAFLAWCDFRFSSNSTYGEIYVQHISNTGLALWPLNGVRVTTSATVHDFKPVLAGDGNNGVIVAWTASNNTNSVQSYIQRIDAGGLPQWTTGGVRLSTATGFRRVIGLISDNNAGAIAVFDDTRNDIHGTDYSYYFYNYFSNYDIYGQRVSPDGSLLWTNAGLPVCTAPGNQTTDKLGMLLSDGNGGNIVVFEDDRNGTSDIYAQKIDASGTKSWPTDGAAVANMPGNQILTDFSVTYSNDNLYVGFQSSIYTTDVELYLQKLNSSGMRQWGANAVFIDGNNANTILAQMGQITGDGQGNIIVAYHKRLSNKDNSDVYAQKVNTDGGLQWTSVGAVVCNRNSEVLRPAVVYSTNGHAIFIWQDYRIFSADIYGSLVDSNGRLVAANSLPVVLSEFDINCTTAGAQIKWVTLSEQNSRSFIIEKSIDGINNWTAIGTVKAVGSSTVPKNYNFLDIEQVSTFYRLRQIDNDGEVNYSSTIKANCSSSKHNLIVYPIPTRNTLNLVISLERKTKVSISLKDVSGKICYQLYKDFSKGMNKVSLNLGGLYSGEFVLVLEGDMLYQSRKVIVTR